MVDMMNEKANLSSLQVQYLRNHCPSTCPSMTDTMMKSLDKSLKTVTQDSWKC